jgi:cystathionine beta-lyase/cystathionine gamma-synthase
MEKKMTEKMTGKITPAHLQTRAVHAGDRKPLEGFVPVTTPIYTASSFIYKDVDTLDKVFGHEIAGPAYARYSNPTNDALEELMASLESGAGALACSSGMAALQVALLTALTDRRKSVVAAESLYGASISLLMKVLDPLGIQVRFVDFCNLDAVNQAVIDNQPGVLLMETITNPILRVAAVDRLAQMARSAGAALIVDNTFATPLVIRPLEVGANFVVHSLTKYLAGHGDVLGGMVVADEENLEALRAYSRIVGPVLGPFESYLAMRGIKTFPLRMERQCANACRVASALAANPAIERVYYPSDPKHPDSEAIRRIFAPNLYGAVVSMELKNAQRAEVFRFLNALKMIVPATSVGDVHSMVLYPFMSSHREVSPKHRERMGIRENLVRLSVGIEGADDIIADLEEALGTLANSAIDSKD